jgi:hypothetical protein
VSEAAKEVWAVGDAYEPYVGRWSRLVARDFIAGGWACGPARDGWTWGAAPVR